MTADPEKLEKRARNVLLYQLSRSMKTEHQLREIMIRREIPSEVFEPVLQRFKEAQLFDDAEFARAFVNSKTRDGKSVNMIRRELRSKGVAQPLIETATAEITTEHEIERATELAARRLMRMQGLEPAVVRRRLQGYLARRGFSSQVVSAAMRQSL